MKFFELKCLFAMFHTVKEVLNIPQNDVNAILSGSECEKEKFILGIRRVAKSRTFVFDPS